MATMKKKIKYQDGGANGTKGQGKLGPALGIGIPVTGMVAAGANMIKNAVKRRKDRKAEEEKKKAAEEAKKMSMKKMGGSTMYMTGGMVNANAKVSALTKAGSNGVKSGVNPKAKASTTAKGRTGGTSKAPKGATPTKNKRG